MTTFTILALAVAFLCFLIAAFAGNVVSNGAAAPRAFGVNLVALGLASWVLVELVVAVRAA